MEKNQNKGVFVVARNQGYDITGQRFGKLVVLGKGESKGPGRTTWNCKCDCGNEKNIRGDALKSGYTKSCGNCLRSEKAIKELFVMVPVPLREVCENARKNQLTFGQYVAKEYTRRMKGGGWHKNT